MSLIVGHDGEQVADYHHGAALGAHDAEVALLGLCLAESELPAPAREHVLERVSARLGTDGTVFGSPMLQAIYTSMLTVTGRGLLADVLTTHAEMSRRNVGGYSMNDLFTLLTRAHNDVELDFARVEALCQIVLDASARRQLVTLGEHIQQHSAAGTDLEEINRGIERWLGRIRRPTLGADTTIAAAAENYRAQLAEWRASPGILRGTTTGLGNLDRVTHGWRPGQLIVLAARMSMGKSAYALSFTLAAARAIMESTDGRHDHQVGFISLEMDEQSLLHRLVAAEAGVDGDRMLEGDPALDWERIEEAVTSLAIMPIRIVDAHGANNRVNGQQGQMTVEAIREHALAWHREGRLDLLVIDFLGCIKSTKEMRREPYERQIATIVQSLKNLASELQVPVLLLVQLNRENEKSGNPVPQLHHLRDSDAIGQFADVVIFPVRWDYYRERGIDVPETVKNRPKGYTELYLQKQRMGKVKAVRVYSDMASNRVWEWSEERGGPVDHNGRLIYTCDARGLVVTWKPEYWPENGSGR